MPSKQWAAVRTQRDAMTAPPQRIASGVLRSTIATCQDSSSDGSGLKLLVDIGLGAFLPSGREGEAAAARHSEAEEQPPPYWLRALSKEPYKLSNALRSLVAANSASTNSLGLDGPASIARV